MACYFWGAGKDFDVDDFLANSTWRTDAAIARKGERKSVGTGVRNHASFSITVNDDDNATIAQQVAACRLFIQQHFQELKRLQNFPGVEARWFSLAYYLPIGEVAAICPYFETDFLSALLSVGADFEFNVFCCSAVE